MNISFFRVCDPEQTKDCFTIEHEDLWMSLLKLYPALVFWTLLDLRNLLHFERVLPISFECSHVAIFVHFVTHEEENRFTDAHIVIVVKVTPAKEHWLIGLFFELGCLDVPLIAIEPVPSRLNNHASESEATESVTCHID